MKRTCTDDGVCVEDLPGRSLKSAGRERNGSSGRFWIHALGSKVGGGLTYLYAVIPELARQAGEDAEFVLLLPGPWSGAELPKHWDVRVMPRAARTKWSRMHFDQWTLPRLLADEPNAVLYCSGSFGPVMHTVPTITLLRNALYFDNDFLVRETIQRRWSYQLQGRLIAAAAARSDRILYPSQAMRSLVESARPELKSADRGLVLPYGVNPAFFDVRDFRNAQPRKSDAIPLEFLYVMTYSLHKNLNYLLRALVLALKEGLPIRVVLTADLASGRPLYADADMKLIKDNALIERGALAPVGTQRGEPLKALYRRAAGCVFVSMCESFGHPLVEALAAGVPLIAADQPYAREMCGSYARYCNLDDPQSLVAIWREWPKIAAELTPCPTEVITNRFNWSLHAGTLLAIADQLRSPTP